MLATGADAIPACLADVAAVVHVFLLPMLPTAASVVD